MSSYIGLWVANVYQIFTKHKLWIYSMILLFTGSFFLLGQVYGQGNILQKHADTYEDTYGEGMRYSTQETLSDQLYYAYLDETNLVEYDRLVQFQEKLAEAEEWRYSVVVEQPVEWMDASVPECFRYGYEEGHASYAVSNRMGHAYVSMKALQVSDGFFSEFGVSVAEGRKFAKQEYQYDPEGETIPVLLGSAYREVCEIGDRFSGMYLFEPMTFCVVGFLDENAFFFQKSSSSLTSCERYVVLPALSVEQPSYFSKIMLLQQIGNGILCTQNSYGQVKEQYHTYQAQCGLEQWQLDLLDPDRFNQIAFQLETYEAMTTEVADTFRRLLLVVFGMTVISQWFLLCGLIREQHQTFGVHMLCGASFGQIAAVILSVIWLILLISDAAACWLLYQKAAAGMVLFVLQFVVLGIGLLLSGSSLWYLQKLDVSEIIGGGE